MTTPDERLATMPTAPPREAHAPRIALVQRCGDTLLVAGQVAVRNGALLASGRVGEDLEVQGASACAWQCARNVLEVLFDDLGSLADVQAVRLCVYVASAPGFTDQHLVAHGASQALLAILGESRGHHVRTAIGVAALPTGSPVEVDGTFRVCAS